VGKRRKSRWEGGSGTFTAPPVHVRPHVFFYFVSSRRKVIRSFRSLAFFNPPKAIFVPGMYFLGFSRYSNYFT